MAKIDDLNKMSYSQLVHAEMHVAGLKIETQNHDGRKPRGKRAHCAATVSQGHTTEPIANRFNMEVKLVEAQLVVVSQSKNLPRRS